MFHYISLRALRNSEFIRFSKNVLKICRENNAHTSGIEAAVGELQAAAAPLDYFFAKERGNAITPELKLLDGRRNAALVGIRFSALGNSYHHNSVIAAAGRQIVKAFDQFGTNLTRLNYMAKTQVFASLCNNLQHEAELQAAVELLMMEDRVKELSLANNLFNNLYLARNTDYAAQPKGNMLSQRERVIDAWQRLTGNITAHAQLNPLDGYTKLIDEINSLTSQYNLLLTNRRNGEENEPADELAADDDKELQKQIA